MAMSSSNKEFEEQLIDAGNKLLDPPSSVEDLLPLLDKAEYYLSRVEQSPNKSIEDAISPCTKALVADKLFRHSDIDVMVAVASCISEITRITAPEAPYTDEQMKEAFQLIVSSFDHLDDKSSRSFDKRTSILETLAKVRSCVVMLDLECDTLILQMFQHFLKTIRDYHSEKVFSSMETIMTLVIEESEDISSELLSPILDTLKKDNEGVLPAAKRLGEKVFENCSAKLKAYLGQTLQSLGTSVDDYSEVVRMIREDDSAENRTNASPAGEPEVETEVASPKSEVSNGEKPAAENETLADAVSVKQPESAPQRTRLKITGLLSKDKHGKSDTEKETKTPGKSKKTSRKRGRKWSSAKKSTKAAASTAVDGEKEPGKSLDNGEDPSGNLPRSPQENQSAGADLPSGDGKKDNVAHPPKETAIGSIDVSFPSKSEEPKKKEEPPKETEGPVDLGVKENSEHGKKSGGGASNEDRTPIKVKISRKRTETTDNAKTNSEKPSSEKVSASNHEDGSSLKSLETKDKEGPAKAEKVHENDMAMSSEKFADQEAVLPSKSTKKRRRDDDQPVEASKDKGKNKQTPGKEEASDSKEYGEELVGSKVKVWWPKDKAYYEGIVDSFDSKKKRHRILYTDGDEEILNLRRQRWEIIQDVSGPNEEKMAAEETRESSPEIPLKKLLGMRINKKLSSRKGKVTSSKKSEVVLATPDHKPQEDSKNDENLEAESSGKSKDNNTPNIGSKLVGLARRMTSKSKGSSDNEKEPTETKKANSKKDLNTTAKARTPRSVGRTKKVKTGDADKLKSSSSKAKPKESKDALRDSSGEPSDKRKSSLLKAKSEDIKVDKDSVDQPSDKVKSGSSKLKEKETKEVGSGSGEEPSAKVKSSSSMAKQKLKLKESKEMVVDSGQDSSEKVKSKLKQKRKLKESEDVDTSTEEDPSDKLKSATSKKQKPKLKESKEVVKDSEEEPPKKVKSSSLKLQKPKLKESKVDEASGQETSDKVKTSSLKLKPKPKPKENEEVKPGSGEETSDKLNTDSSKLKPTMNPEENKEVEPEPGEEPSDQRTDSSKSKPDAEEKEMVVELDSEETEEDTASEREKPLVKPPTSGRRTGKKRRREA